MPRGIPLTEEEQEKRRQEIFESALPLILEQGFSKTSMREIAQATGVGKSTLYDYFGSKEDIIIFYFRNGMREIIDRAQKINEEQLSVKEKIVGIMTIHLEHLVADKKSPLLQIRLETQHLSKQSQKQLQAIRYEYQDMLCELIKEGIRLGELRAVDPLFAARTITILLANAAYTSRPTGSPEEMLDEALGILFKGIQA